MRLPFLFTLLVTLAGCCPAPEGAVTLQETAFRAEVVTVSPDAVRVRPQEDGSVTSVTLAEARLLDAMGNPIEPGDLAPDALIYVRGTLSGRGVRADELRLLD